jgi:hypothetical protein
MEKPCMPSSNGCGQLRLRKSATNSLKLRLNGATKSHQLAARVKRRNQRGVCDIHNVLGI